MAAADDEVVATPARLVAVLRTGVDYLAPDVPYQIVYETWLTRETWHIEREALPLLVGVEPSLWPGHVERHALTQTREAALRALVDAFGCAPTAALQPQRLAQWARRHEIVLPLPFARVLEFLQQVLPAVQSTSVPGAAAATASDNERVLGAALALISRFPAACRGADGGVSSDTLTTLILSQAPEWFPTGPPALSRDDIVAVLERYLV